MSVMSRSGESQLSEPGSPLSSSSRLSSYSASCSAPSSPSSSSSSRRSRPFLPRVHLSGTSQCSIQEARYAEYLQRRSAMKAVSPLGLYPRGPDEAAGSRRVQRSLMSEFEGAEETTEEEETSGEETRSDTGSDSEREGSSRTAQPAADAAALAPSLALAADKRAVSAPSTASVSVSASKSAVSDVASAPDSLEKELPLLMDMLFADDEESTEAEQRPRRRINPKSLPPLPPLPVSPTAVLSPKAPTASTSAAAASSPARPTGTPPAALSSPSAPSSAPAPTKHFIFRSSASPTSATTSVSYPALVSASRVAITPAPRRSVSASETPKAATGSGAVTGTGSGNKASAVSSFFSFGKKAAAAASSPTTSPSASTASPTAAASKSPSASATPSPASPQSASASPLASAPSSPAATSAKREVIVRSSYLLTAVDAEPTTPGRTFLCLDLTASASSTPALQVVEDERVVREIHLASIARCSADMDDAHVVSVMYATKRAGATTDTNDRVEFQLASLLDAQHVRTIVNNVITHGMAAYTATSASVSPSTSSPSLSRSIAFVPPSPSSPASASPSLSASVGQSHSCVQKGYLDLHCASDKDTPWQRRFARLYPNRLVLYRTSSSSLPLHVYPLNVSPLSAARSTVRTNRYQHIVVDLASEQSGVRLVTMRCEGPEEFRRWMTVLTAQLSASTTSAADVDEKGREPSVSSSLSSHSLSSLSAQLGRVMSLAPLLSNQRAFMSYVFELSTLSPFFASALPSPAAFVLQTPATFLRRRHQSLLSVEVELGRYDHLLSALERLWKESRLVMVDEMEQSGSGQIGFSFPGFDSQVFDVGRLSVVCCGQLLAAPSLASPHPLTFSQHDYHSAIDSSSPMKELMTQAAPDLTSMLHASSPSARHAAKQLSAQSQRLLLHHCTMASHMKSEWAKWRSGDRVSWAAMAAVGATAAKRNERALACYANVEYVWNPSLGALHRCIQAVKAAHQVDALTASMSFPPVDSLAQPNNPVMAGLPVAATKEAAVSPSGNNAGSGSNTPNKLSLFSKARGKSSSLDTTTSGSPATPLSVSSPASPSSPSSPASPLSAVPALPAASLPEVRCLVDAIHLVFLLRTLLHYRRHALSSLHSAILPALAAHSREHSVAGVLSSLLEAIERERAGVVRVLSVLPSQAEIEREDKRQRRERKERRREADKRRAAADERRREESLQLQIAETKQLMLDWDLDASRSDVSYFYPSDSATGTALDSAADGLMADTLEQSVAELMHQ